VDDSACVKPLPPSGKLMSRVEASEGVWVYWPGDGREDVSRARNLNWQIFCREFRHSARGHQGKSRFSTSFEWWPPVFLMSSHYSFASYR
jgi:hypothetical protein